MKLCSSSEAVSSSFSTSAVSDQSQLATSSSTADKSPSLTATTAEDLAVGSREAGGGQETVTVDRRGEYSAVCRWTVHKFPRIKARALWSKYFEVGGYDCRLLVYPKGDTQALPGYISIYLQIMDPRCTSSSKWDCFASYRLAIVNVMDDSKTIHRDSWHRFSSKKKSHGWCDFTPSSSVFDSKLGYLFNNDSVLITADILILNESVNFTRDNNEPQTMIASSSSVVTGPVSDVLSGKFTWKVRNFSLFKEIIRTQKIMSPVFPAGECNLRISVYQSSVNGVDYLSMCLESKDTEKTILLSDRSSWCLFRMSVLNQKPGSNHMHRDSYGRFAADNKSGDNTSLGWNDYMMMLDFVGDSGFLVDDTAVFSTSFHVIKESINFSKNGGLIAGRIGSGARKSDGHVGKFTWRIENFTRLKDLLKKRKITGICIKSRRFQVGNQDCRLIVYPRGLRPDEIPFIFLMVSLSGQSQPPCHLSVFLEVTDSRNTSSDWSCFVSHRLSVVNQRMEEKSITKESQNRYSKAAKDWGWREFVTLTSLFDQDSGFLVQDSVVFSAEVLVLKETSIMQDFTEPKTESVNASSQLERPEKISSFTWKVENFLGFKEIMETRKIFSKFFQFGECELRIGVYESFDTICIYLESDQSVGSDLDKNFWVRYRMAVVNQKNPAKTVCKESSICTKMWNNSVLQFMKVSDILEADAGFLVRDNVIFVCEILDYCPWFEFSDLEVFASEDDQDALTTDPDELVDSEDSEGISGDEEDMFRNLISRAGFHLTYGDNPSQPLIIQQEKLLVDAGAIAGFLTGLRVYLDDPAKVKRLLLPTKLSETDESSSSLMNLLMGVKVLQQAIIDLLLDIMVACCQLTEGNFNADCSSLNLKFSPDRSEAACSLQSDRENEALETDQFPILERLDSGVNKSTSASAMQSSDMSGDSKLGKAIPGECIYPPEISVVVSENVSLQSKAEWPEQSEELLGLIVNSLRALDGAVPQGCPEPQRRPQSAHKIAIVLDKAPMHLQPDLVGLVPKLVEHSEHSLAAFSLLERLQKPDAESLRIPVFGSLSQLECDSEVWERVLFQSFELLTDSNDELLAATIEFIFKAASQCQHLPEAVRSVRAQLKGLGVDVSPCVLEFLSKTVNSWGDVAETILRDIDCDGENGTTSERLHLVVDQDFRASCHFSDIYLLVEMLSIPYLAVEASQTFERVVSRGSITAHSVALVLERRLAQRLSLNARLVAENFKHTEAVMGDEQLSVQGNDFTAVLDLAETLAISRDSRVRGFFKMLYTLLFKLYADESLQWKMLKRLVDRATSSTDSSGDVDLYFDILFTLASEEQKIIRPVLNMMREVAQLANVERDDLWHKVCAIEDEIDQLREKMEGEISNEAHEKAVISKKLSEVEGANYLLKSKMKAEMYNFARERKELSEQIQEVESQLEWLRLERDDEIKKLGAEKKALQDRLHDAEAQISQLKSRNREELKKLIKEKNALAERLKNAEAACKRYDEELKRYATENVARVEIRQSLENEVQRLTQTVGKTEGEKREKEEQVARCEAYIDGMESELQARQRYIRTLQVSIQEEISKNASLLGQGLESLSMKDLEILTRIHEEGLRKILALQQRNGNPAGNPFLNPHAPPHNQALYHAPPPSMAVGMPPSLIQNGVGIHGSGHMNGVIGPWFNHN